MRYSELTKKLKKAGCIIKRHGSKHDEWYSPITGNTFQVPRHNSQEVKKGLANAILKDSGLKK